MRDPFAIKEVFCCVTMYPMERGYYICGAFFFDKEIGTKVIPDDLAVELKLKLSHKGRSR